MDAQGAMQLHQGGKLAEAEASYREILELQPNNAAVLNMLGILLGQVGRIEDGLTLVGRSLEIEPGRAEFHANHATLLGSLGRHVEALAALQEALRLNPRLARAHDSVGVAMDYMGQHHHAIRAFRNAVKFDPGYLEGHLHLGVALLRQGKTDEATTTLCKARALKSGNAEVLRQLAMIAADRGDIVSLIALYHQILPTKQATVYDHCNLVFSMHYDPRSSPADLSEAARDWARQHAEPHTRSAIPPANDRNHNRKIKLAYISSDFRQHPVGRLIEPVISAHDRDRFELTCYSDVPPKNADKLTTRLNSQVDNWREIDGLDDATVLDLIREDGVDLIVELNGHFGNNRLAMLAGRAAPVQISHFGYCNTTGMSAMDYRLTDAHSDPPGPADSLHTERLVRLPDNAWCYCPWESTPPVRPPPSTLSGQITFGNLNNPVKTSDLAAEAWASILKSVPRSKLLMLTPRGSERHVLRRFARLGIAANRLNLITMSPRTIYMDLFNQIDIVLDPFPFGGDNTTCDALWMGVPVVSLVGQTFCARRGLSHLANVGLREWAADSVPQYVQTACNLAQSPARLANLRRELRSRLRESPLGNPGQFIAKLESAYVGFWDTWCKSGAV